MALWAAAAAELLLGIGRAEMVLADGEAEMGAEAEVVTAGEDERGNQLPCEAGGKHVC